MNDRQPRNSLNLNVEGEGSDSNSQKPFSSELKESGNSTAAKETYKSIPEDSLGAENNKKEQTPPPVEVKMVQGNEGADEQMLGKKDEVKFIKGDRQNGDAKIDIGTVSNKAFTGMSKDELMKYANDPFWVRIRWIFFILFWGTWAGMLILSILIIVNAPKCSAPTPLKWYQQGPFAHFKSVDAVAPTDVDIAKKIHATGVVYELAAEETYSVKDPKVEEKIKKLVETYKGSEINVILDLTPNYVTKDSILLKDALSDETKRSAFIWIEKAEVPNNWLSIVNGSAWTEVQPGNYVLSQFGDGLYDLHMNDTIVKKELKGTLQHLLGLGVNGFRLKNSKFFLITPTIQDEVPNTDPNFFHNQYGFWTHSQTTFQEGLGEVLYEYRVAVKNVSMDAFLSINEDTIRPEVYQVQTGEYGIDLPIYGRFPHMLSAPEGKNLYTELHNTVKTVGNGTWLQWNYEPSGAVDASAYTLFLSMLPGVPVIPADSAAAQVSAVTLQHINHLRESASYMHGEFDMYRSGEIVAYSRIKSGNPGYFVAFNPSRSTVFGNFTGVGLPEKMSIDILSDNFNVTDVQAKAKISVDSLALSPYSTAIYTYVPVKSG